MLNVRYDYGFLGKLFGVPRKLLSQLGGFCTSFTVEGRILKATFPAFPVPDKNPVKFWLDEEELAAFIEEQVGATPEDLTHDDITDWDTATAEFLTGEDYDDLSGQISDLTDIADGLSDLLDDVLDELDYCVTVSDVGVSGGVAAYSHTHTGDQVTYGSTTVGGALDALYDSMEALSGFTPEVLSALQNLLDSYDPAELITTTEYEPLADLVELMSDDLYDANGNAKFVTTNTSQTITGIKTFKGSQMINLDANGGTVARLRFLNGDYPTGYIGVYDHVAPSADMTGTVILGGGNGGTGQGIIIGTASSGPEVRLKTTPTSHDETTSLSVPTMGWVNNLFSRKTHTHSGYAASDHTHSGYASTNHTHSNYATTSSVSNLLGTVDDLADVVDGILADYVTGDDLTTTLSSYSNTDTIAANYAAKTDVESIDGDLADLVDYVDEIDADLGDLSDLADAIDADLYDENGARKFVTTNTSQTVTGVKTFKGSQMINLDANGGAYARLRFLNGDYPTGYIGVYDHIAPCTDMLGTCIFGGGDNGARQALIIGSTKANGGPEVRMLNQPTSHDETTSLSVPTMGWVNNLFSRKTHHHDDVYSKLGHTHSGYASTNHTHSGYASSTHTHTEYAEAEHTHVAADITDLNIGETVNNAITAWSNAQDFGNTYVDWDSYNADMESIATFAEAIAAGITQTVTIGGEVTWNQSGTLTQPIYTITITAGLITGFTTAKTKTIDTAVLVDQN